MEKRVHSRAYLKEKAQCAIDGILDQDVCKQRMQERAREASSRCNQLRDAGDLPDILE